MNASQVGVCALPASAWYEGAVRDTHERVVVIPGSRVLLARTVGDVARGAASSVPQARDAIELRCKAAWSGRLNAATRWRL
jgi:hypothetical protein